MRGIVWLVLLGILLLLAVVGEIRSPPARKTTAEDIPPDPNTVARLERGVAPATRLFILVHGYTPSKERIAATADLLKQYGDVLRIDYPAGGPSNVSPDAVCAAIAAKLAALPGIDKYTDVMFVAHSVGALIARRTLLLGLGRPDEQPAAWTIHMSRIVLLAGTNRGWSLEGQRPVDLATSTRLLWRFLEWLGRMTGSGSFILSFRAGAPFVANLRIDWMNKMRELAKTKPIEVVQLLGDIDDIVSREDSEDLRVMASENYAFLLVRGTGHGDMIEFYKHAKTEEGRKLGEYRQAKIVLAATGKFGQVLKENDEQVYTTQGEIRSVVFVLHGIRDLGRWSSGFETEIRSKVDHVAIVSARYGYLGMGPFLLPSVRDHYVRWFMDQYTETLAKYPNVDASHIQFFGHSNGAYLLAKALEQYSAMRISRVVLAGSVVPKNYDWRSIMEKKIPQVEQVRNYVGTEDWVVALFPRLFELRPFLWLRNELGSSGFSGFDDGGGCEKDRASPVPSVTNVCYVEGEHSAFEGRVTEIVDFLVSKAPSKAAQVPRPPIGWVLNWRVTVWLAWLAITSVIVWIGFRVVLAAPSPNWVVLVLYALLMLRILQTI
jgi:pimeloyl-ACP methyl ester carboxylesterase